MTTKEASIIFVNIAAGLHESKLMKVQTTYYGGVATFTAWEASADLSAPDLRPSISVNVFAASPDSPEAGVAEVRAYLADRFGDRYQESA